jgi:hypothetical protein
MRSTVGPSNMRAGFARRARSFAVLGRGFASVCSAHELLRTLHERMPGSWRRSIACSGNGGGLVVKPSCANSGSANGIERSALPVAMVCAANCAKSGQRAALLAFAFFCNHLLTF